MKIIMIIIITIIIIAIIIAVFYLLKNKKIELFDNIENKKIAKIFIDSQTNNNTFDIFKTKIKDEGISFGKKNSDVKFEPYYEMYKNYNKLGNINPNDIDSIRNKF
jgi:flagellar basal body-associated protein FliL